MKVNDFKMLLIAVTFNVYRRLCNAEHERGLVQWLKVGYCGLDPYSGLQVSKKQNVSFPLTGKDSILWEPR